MLDMHFQRYAGRNGAPFGFPIAVPDKNRVDLRIFREKTA
jgi:hypothetical protein